MVRWRAGEIIAAQPPYQIRCDVHLGGRLTVRTHRATLADRGLNGGADEEPRAADFSKVPSFGDVLFAPFPGLSFNCGRTIPLRPATLKRVSQPKPQVTQTRSRNIEASATAGNGVFFFTHYRKAQVTCAYDRQGVMWLTHDGVAAMGVALSTIPPDSRHMRANSGAN
jgi:hypothetical protein